RRARRCVAGNLLGHRLASADRAARASMKPVSPSRAFAAEQRFVPDATEAAPARNRIRFLAIGLMLVLLLLSTRAIQLAFSGDPNAEPRRSAALAPVERAAIVDRTGEL